VSRFARFCVVGTLGFLIDAGVLQALVSGLGTNPYVARIASFLAAATATWWMNRRFTFGVTRSPSRREWFAYIGLMLLGGVINYGTYAALITNSSFARAHLWIGVAVGSIAGLVANFLSSRRLLATRA
jgi:putative flippase GtrA